MAKDIFGEIAANRNIAQSDDLWIPTPQPASTRVLPLDEKEIKIDQPDRPNSPEELETALKQMRDRMTPFLADHSPPIKDQRTRTPIHEFSWRVETDDDRTNPQGVFAGIGDWERVSIPHYGEPIGKASTWYRTSTPRPRPRKNERIFLHFDGVDYKAHVFVNGYYVGSHEGFFAPFEFDITDYIKSDVPSVGERGGQRGGQHGDDDLTLSVRVENDYIFMSNDDPPADAGTPGTFHQGDKLYAATGLGYDDPLHGWHHCPPGMGICQPVYLEHRSPIFISDIFVRPIIELDRAELWVEIESSGIDEHHVSVEYSIYGRNFEERVVEGVRYDPAILEHHGSGDVDRGEAMVKPLLMGPGVNYLRIPVDMPNPRLWTPAEPWLYSAQIAAIDEHGDKMDESAVQFGMRSFLIDEGGGPKGTALSKRRTHQAPGNKHDGELPARHIHRESASTRR